MRTVYTQQAMLTRLEVETLTRESIIRSIVSVLTALIVMMYQSGWSECGPQSRTV
jgi:hypothetical protein